MKPLWKPQYEAVSAATALRKGQAVKLAANDNQVTAVTAAADRVHGFADRATDANADTQIYREGGEAIGYSAGAITKGAALKINNDGDLEATSTANDLCVGYALEAASDNSNFAFMFTRFKL